MALPFRGQCFSSFCRTGSSLSSPIKYKQWALLWQKEAVLCPSCGNTAKAQVGAAVVLMLLMLLWAGEAGGWCCCVRHVCWLKRSILFSASVLSSSHSPPPRPCLLCESLASHSEYLVVKTHFLSRDYRASTKSQESHWWWGSGGWERMGRGPRWKVPGNRSTVNNNNAGVRGWVGEIFAGSRATLLASSMWLLELSILLCFKNVVSGLLYRSN